MLTPEKTIDKLLRIYSHNDSFKYKTAGEGIRETLNEFCPSLSQDFEQIHFSFIKSNQIRAYSAESENRVDFIFEDLSPLKLYACVASLNCKNKSGVDKIDYFVSFLTELSPETLTSPPAKKTVQILFDWYAENVFSRVWISSGLGKGLNGSLWSWSSETKTNKQGKVFEKAYIPENFMLKDIVAHILMTGKLPDTPKRNLGVNQKEEERE